MHRSVRYLDYRASTQLHVTFIVSFYALTFIKYIYKKYANGPESVHTYVFR